MHIEDFLADDMTYEEYYGRDEDYAEYCRLNEAGEDAGDD